MTPTSDPSGMGGAGRNPLPRTTPATPPTARPMSPRRDTVARAKTAPGATGSGSEPARTEVGRPDKQRTEAELRVADQALPVEHDVEARERGHHVAGHRVVPEVVEVPQVRD